MRWGRLKEFRNATRFTFANWCCVLGLVSLWLTASPSTIAQDGQWSSYGGNPGGGHYSDLDQITATNLESLEVAWEHRSGDFRLPIDWDIDTSLTLEDGKRAETQTSLQVTPIVVNDTLYYCTPYNRVFALDPVTGQKLWVFDPGVNTDDIYLTNCRGVSSWQARNPSGAACDHRIFTGTLDGRLFALDAVTGKPCLDFGFEGQINLRQGLGEHIASEYNITSPPAILGDLVITGAMVLDNRRTDSPGGVVRAFNVRTGELVWHFDPIAPGTEPELIDEGQRYQKGTTNVWSIMSVDPQRNLVFVPTGNSQPDYFGGHRGGLEKGLDYYSSSVIALDGSTGEVVWNFQAVHHDIWDWDTPAQPTLYDVVMDGSPRAALAQPTKMGHLFLLDRVTGEPLFGVEEKPVPQGDTPGEYYAPTQPFPVMPKTLVRGTVSEETAWGLTPWDRNACKEIIRNARWEGIFTPPSTQGSITYPFQGGGNNWDSPAIDPQRNIIVLPTNHIAGLMTLYPREECDNIPGAHPQEGTPYCVTPEILLSPLGLPCTPPPWNTLDAINLTTGELLWSVPLGTTRDMAPFPFWFFDGTPGLGGPLLTAAGLTFIAGSGDHYFRAFNTSTGEELWRTRLPTQSAASPMSYRGSDGRQYIVIAAGGHWSGKGDAGDYLRAYALPAEN